MSCEAPLTRRGLDPDPSVESNLTDLIDAVKRSNADVGIAFDGDGDRMLAVDETGAALDGDQIVAAFDGTQPHEEAQTPSLARVEWEHIQRIYELCGRNVSETRSPSPKPCG